MTTSKSKIASASEARKIYESPDGGKTVYAREFGSDRKVLVKQDTELVERQKTATRANRLMTILKLSKTDTTLKDALEALEALYIIKYNDDKND